MLKVNKIFYKLFGSNSDPLANGRNPIPFWRRWQCHDDDGVEHQSSRRIIVALLQPRISKQVGRSSHFHWLAAAHDAAEDSARRKESNGSISIPIYADISQALDPDWTTANEESGWNRECMGVQSQEWRGERREERLKWGQKEDRLCEAGKKKTSKAEDCWTHFYIVLQLDLERILWHNKIAPAFPAIECQKISSCIRCTKRFRDLMCPPTYSQIVLCSDHRPVNSRYVILCSHHRMLGPLPIARGCWLSQLLDDKMKSQNAWST